MKFLAVIITLFFQGLSFVVSQNRAGRTDFSMCWELEFYLTIKTNNNKITTLINVFVCMFKVRQFLCCKTWDAILMPIMRLFGSFQRT